MKQIKIAWKPIGVALFYLLTPIWFVLSKFWWKADAAFVLINILMMFEEPWDIK